VHPTSLLDRHVFLDVETTGLDAQSDEIIEIGAVMIRGGAVERRHWLVRPRQPLPPVISALTGLTDDQLEGAASLDELKPELTALFSNVTVVAHNALFERSFLASLLDGVPVLDSCELALVLFPELPSHSLDALVRWAGVARGTHHRALEDASDSFEVVKIVLERAAEPSRRAQLGALARRLEGLGPLEQLVEQLANAALTEAPARAEPSKGPPLELPGVLQGWASAPSTLALELEVSDVDSVVVEAARSMSGDVWVVAPHGRLKRLSLPRLPSSRGGSVDRLEALLSRRIVVDPALAAAMAYLQSWGERTSLELGALSGFWRDRVPLFDAMRVLLETSGTTSPPTGVCAGTHHDVAAWLARGRRPDALIWLDAPALVDFERRRLTVSLDLPRVFRLPELFELAAPGRPIGAALRAVHDATKRLGGLLTAFSQPALIDRSAVEPWSVLKDALSAVGHELAWWLSGLRGGPLTPLIEGVIGEASALAEVIPRLLAPSERTELWAGASGVWLRPSTAACEASAQTLVGAAPSLLISDVRRGTPWERRLGPWPIERHGLALPASPLAIVDRLESAPQIASVALSDPGPCTVLLGEGLDEGLVAAFVAAARQQGRAVRLGTVGLGPNDVLLKEWWGAGSVPECRGSITLVNPGDPLGVRRLVARGERVSKLVLSEPFTPARWQSALEGFTFHLAAMVTRSSTASRLEAR
jgi:hypothetical protein